jgi:hypothetical protein
VSYGYERDPDRLSESEQVRPPQPEKDPAAPLHELASNVGNHAFATGTDVYFAKGEYSPGSADGDKLIAHELAHVVQQRGAPQGGPLSVSQPGDAMETEADDVADHISS